MIIHIVLLKFREDVEDAKVQEFISGIKQLEELDSVLSANAGKQEDMYEGYVSRNQGYTHALVTHHKDGEALKSYAQDPKHIAVKDNYIAPNLDKNKDLPILAVDFKC